MDGFQVEPSDTNKQIKKIKQDQELAITDWAPST